MKEAIAKAAALVEAGKYIRDFQGKTVVVKVGGSIMDSPDSLRRLLVDLCLMATVGMRPIVVHGGGKSITDAMNRAGLQAEFVKGRRYTDERTLAIAEHVLVNEINRGIVETIDDAGQRGMALNSLSSCVISARRLFLEEPDPDGRDGVRKIDLGQVGQVSDVNAELLHALTEARLIPVIAPIALDAGGGKLNVNADSVAGHVAAAVRAEKLVLVSDTHGIRRSLDAEDLATHLTRREIEALIDEGIINAGMLPKVESCLTALEGGVHKAHIVDGRIEHSLLLEIYTAAGIGTEIVL